MKYTIPFKPGVTKDDALLASDGLAVDSDKIIYKTGKPESMPGYVNALPGQAVDGPGRGHMTWSNLRGELLEAIGTTGRLYANRDSVLGDITPLAAGESDGDLTAVAASTTVTFVEDTPHGYVPGQTIFVRDPGASRIFGRNYSLTGALSVVSGNSLVLIQEAAHGYETGDFVEITGATAVQGMNVNGEHYVVILDADTWGIDLATFAAGTAVGGGTMTIDSAPAVTVATVVDDLTFTVELPAPSGVSVTHAHAPITSMLRPGLLNGNYPGGYSQGGFGVGPFGSDNLPSQKALFRPRVWALDNWGEDLIANPLGGSIYAWSPVLSQRAERIPNSPRQCDWVIVTPERVLMAFACSDVTDVYNPMLVRWTSIQDREIWFPSSTNSAGDALLSSGSEIRSARALANGIAVFTDTSFFLGRFTSDYNSVYSFDFVGSECGIIGPRAVAERNGKLYWLSTTGFVQFDSGAPKVLVSTIERFVLNAIEERDNYKIFAATDSEDPAVMWFYPTVRPAGRECDRYARYDFDQGPPGVGWSVGTMNMTTWVGTAKSSFPKPRAVRTDGMICNHRTGSTADGAPWVSLIEFSPLEMLPDMSGDGVGAGGRILNLSMILLDILITGQVDVYATLQRELDAPKRVRGPWPMSATKKRKSLKAPARYIGLKVESKGFEYFWRLGAPKFDVTAGSRR